jgi:hypothetical protein
MNRILVGVAALALAGAYVASADVLVMEDGRRITGELVSVNRGTVIFDEVRSGSTSKRRMRVNKEEVSRIVLRESRSGDDEDLDSVDDGPFGSGRDDRRDDNRDDGRVGDRSNGRRDRDPDDPRTDERFPGDRDRGTVERGRAERRDPDDPRTDERYPRDRDRGASDADRTVERPDFGDDRPVSGRDRLISVSARQAWTDTGIDVATGDVVRFSAEGNVVRGPGQEDGPAGEMNSPINERRPVPARPAGALIGRIGTSPSDVFFIGGDRGSFRVRSSGRLYLGVNDHYYADNSGSFEVRVTR